MDLFWIFKKEITDNSCGYFHWLFLPDSNKCFFICLATYIHICLYYFLILCSYFHLLFLLFLPQDILLFTMFDLISLQPAYNITEIRKTLYSSRRKKKCHINYNQNKCSKNMVYTKYEFFLPPFHILINILFRDKKIS